MLNKFFTKKDSRQDKVIFDLDAKFWWSSLYFYKLGLNMVKANDTCLVTSCGLCHPFKFALVNECKKVCACDNLELSKENILKEVEDVFGKNLNEKLVDNIEFKIAEIDNLPYKDNYFTKIFSLGQLQHKDVNVVENGLREMKRVLKDNGKIIVGIEYPTLTPDELLKIIEKVGLKIDGDFDYSFSKNDVNSDYFGKDLKCYSIILIK